MDDDRTHGKDASQALQISIHRPRAFFVIGILTVNYSSRELAEWRTKAKAWSFSSHEVEPGTGDRVNSERKAKAWSFWFLWSAFFITKQGLTTGRIGIEKQSF